MWVGMNMHEMASFTFLACESIRFSFALRRWGPSGVERRRNGCFRRLHIPCSPDLQYMLMAMKKERDAGVDDDGSVAVESTAFTLSRQFLT